MHRVEVGAAPSPEGVFVDSLEHLRGALCALSYVSPRQAREVHVIRLRYAFERAGLIRDFRPALAAVKFIREIQPLARGFWIPVPVRAVPLGEYSLLIAPHAMLELRRRFGDKVAKAGYARIAPSTEFADVPVQSLVDWMGSDTLHIDDWTERQLGEARSQLKQTFAGQGEFEAFVPAGPLRSGVTTTGWWSADLPAARLLEKPLRLCRKQTAVGRHRFFFGELDRGRLVTEAPFVGDVDRMQIGLLRKEGGSPFVRIEAHGEVAELRATVSFPQAERRFLAAIGRRVVESEGRGRKYEIPNLAVGTVLELVHRLGCSTESH